MDWYAEESAIVFGNAVPLLESDGNSTPPHAVFVLRELLENGQASVTGADVRVSCEEIGELASSDLEAMGLPGAPPYTLRINSVGTLNESTFSYDWAFYDSKVGERISTSRKGVILLVGPESFLLSKDQYKLCVALDTFNCSLPEERSYAMNLVAFSAIKKIAVCARASMDRYLENESAVVPARITLDLKGDVDGRASVLPKIDEDPTGKFTTSFDRYPSAKETYSISNEANERTRVVFSEEQLAALHTVKSLKNAGREEFQEFLEHPESFLDPDIVDMDGFSDRVAEIGLYKPKYSAYVSAYKSDWVPVLMIEMAPGVREAIEIDSRESLDAIEKLFLDALRTETDEVSIDGHTIPVEEVQKLIDTSREHFEKVPPSGPSRKVTGDGGENVLLIKENIDSLEYSVNSSGHQSLEHELEYPPNLDGSIRLLSHQVEGVAWLQSAYKSKISGVLLADDMGLGKTLQVLSFLEWHQACIEQQRNAYLVVAPVSLLENWQAEYERFFPTGGMKVVPIYGSSGNVSDAVSICSAIPPSRGNAVLCLTTYETLRKQQKSLCRVDWSCVVLDEAQRIKTPGTLVTNAAKALKAQFRIAMTGTPVENSFLDIWCIMDFSVPGLLGSAKSFAGRYQKPLRTEGTDVAQLGEALRQEIGIHLKRRFKTDVAKDLPQKLEYIQSRAMPKVQLSRYQSIIERIQETRKRGDAQDGYMLQAIAEMRAVSNHPYLADTSISERNIDELVEVAARLQLVIEIIAPISERQEKCIVFSDSRPMQHVLARVIQASFHLPHVSIINGCTPASARKGDHTNPSRQQAINRFQDQKGFNAIVMSPLAAGVGLNVTGANHVIHFSRHWNPAREAQATDRAYRIGQTKDVHVHYLLAVADGFDTFDVVLHDLLDRKKELASASLFPSEMVEVRTVDLFGKLC